MDISGDIICLFGYLIYLEIIELNFFNLNYDIKESIAFRGISNDFNTLSFSDQVSIDENNNQYFEMESQEDELSKSSKSSKE